MFLRKRKYAAIESTSPNIISVFRLDGDSLGCSTYLGRMLVDFHDDAYNIRPKYKSASKVDHEYPCRLIIGAKGDAKDCGKITGLGYAKDENEEVYVAIYTKDDTYYICAKKPQHQ